jgi:elongation factor G
MKVEVVTPDDYLGAVTGDLNRRRAIVEEISAKQGIQYIRVKVPLSEMFGYITNLRSLTSGRGTVTMEFSHYTPPPTNIQEALISKWKLNNN